MIVRNQASGALSVRSIRLDGFTGGDGSQTFEPVSPLVGKAAIASVRQLAARQHDGTGPGTCESR